jgi:hypothetical protein
MPQYTSKDIARFWSKVKVGAPDECWEWQAGKDKFGYGDFGVHSRHRIASRVAYEITNGPLPDRICVLHKCDNPPCCNPRHLFPGTRADNIRDMESKGRAKHPKGESFSVSKLTEDQVRYIRSSKDSMQKLAQRFGVQKHTIWEVKHYLTWKHIP